MTDEGYAVERLGEIYLAQLLFPESAVHALIVASRSLGLADVLALRKCHLLCPSKAIVVVTSAAPEPVLKRALESGATAFLSWPATREVVCQALRSRARNANGFDVM